MSHLFAQLLTRHRHLNWALTDQTMVSGVNFLWAIILARFLGLEEFGRFSLAWMAVLFALGFQGAMIISPMMSIGPKQSAAETPFYYGAVIVQQVLLSGLIFLAMLTATRLGAAAFPEWNVESLAFPLASAALAFLFQNFFRRYFFTRGRGSTAFATDAIYYLGQIAVLLWLLLVVRDGINSAKVLWALSAAGAAATLYGALQVERIEWSRGVFRATASHHWHFSKWLLGSSIMHWTSGNFFIVAAGALLGAAAVGALKAAQTLMGVTHIFFMGLENVVPIRASWHLRHGGKSALIVYLKRVTLFGELATASIATIVAIAPDFWLQLIFGSEYIGYGHVLRWFAVTYLFLFLGLPLTAGLHAIEHTRTIFWARCWSTFFSLVAAYPMINLLGISGAVAGLLVANVILITVLMYGLKNRLSRKDYFYEMEGITNQSGNA